MRFKGILVFLLVLSLGVRFALGVGSTSVVIYAFDQNPAGSDEGNEWVVLHNPTNTSINVSNWTLSTTHGKIVNVTIPQGTSISINEYWLYTYDAQWLDNSEESIILRNAEGQGIDRSIVANDGFNDNRYWVRDPNGIYIGPTSNWRFKLQTLEEGVMRNATCVYIVDGDTIDISPVGIAGIQRIRLAGIDTPEEDEDGYEEAKNFTMNICLGKKVEFDVDDEEQYDDYNRILAVVYVNGINLNKELLCNGYAGVLYIPPSEFNPYDWYNSCLGTSKLTVTATPSSITLGNVNVTVTITVINATSKENVSNANVSISGAGIISASALTVNGIAIFTSVTPISEGTITVTVTKTGYNDGSASIAVVTTSTTTTTSTATSTTTTATTLPCNGDANNDGVVTDFELLNYIDKWTKAQVPDFDLLKAIDNWAKD